MTLSLESIASSYFKAKQASFETLPNDNPLKILDAKLSKGVVTENIAIDEELLKGYPWIESEKYKKVFGCLETAEQQLLGTYRQEMLAGLAAELLKSRDQLTETDEVFIEKQVRDYICNTWFL